MKKVALITGVTGQDGSYLARFLLSKGYETHGICRRSSSDNTSRISELIDISKDNSQLILHYGDMTDTSSLSKIINSIGPDEIYNLAAQSHVSVSFELPEYTANADALGTLRILEIIRNSNLINKTKFYQASTSELYGLVQETPQKESTPFYPRSPYAVAKLYAHWITINYRQAYNIFACNGILFNHESPFRGETFITRKITRALTRIKYGLQKTLYIGNLESLRDWGHARDYVEMQWLMLQQDEPDDYVIATGVQCSVRNFINLVANVVGINLRWRGEGLNEIAIDDLNQTIIAIDSKFYRPTEVESLLGDSTKAYNKLGWKPKTTLKDLISEMVEADSRIAKFEYENSTYFCS